MSGLTITQLFDTKPGPELDNHVQEALGGVIRPFWRPSTEIADAFEVVNHAESFLLFKNSGNPQWKEGAFVCCMVDMNGRIQKLMEEKRPTTNHETNKIIQSVAKYQVEAPTPALAMCWAFLFARIVDAQKVEAAEEKGKLEVVKSGGLLVPGRA